MLHGPWDSGRPDKFMVLGGVKHIAKAAGVYRTYGNAGITGGPGFGSLEKPYELPPFKGKA